MPDRNASEYSRLCRVASCASDLAQHAIVAAWAKDGGSVATCHEKWADEAFHRIAEDLGYEVTRTEVEAC